MSYPPRNAKRPSELGTSAPTKRHIVDRRTDPRAASISLSTTDRTNRAIHTHIATSDELWRLIADAAVAASTNKSTCASRTLWLHLDPPLVSKSAAVKAAVQSLCLDLLLPPLPQESPPPPQTKLSARLAEWVALARDVALGTHALFAQGVCGWDKGIDLQTHNPLRDDQGVLVVSKEFYWPFETYDRTLENPLYANCFGDSQAQSRRSRVRLVDPASKPAVKWRAAEVAHRKMLDLEAKHELFRPRDAWSSAEGADDHSGLTAAELGGLFLLTTLSDNCAKRVELFDLGFWTLRVIHFGLERNLGLHINQFSVEALATTLTPGSSPHSSPQSPPLSEQMLRHSLPDPMRSRCWLENALHCIVALKVYLFLKMRWAAYDGSDNPESEKLLNDQVVIDRHDIEQSKAHWLPSARPKSTQASPLGPGTPAPAPEASDGLPPLAPLPPQAVVAVSNAGAKEEASSPPLHAMLTQRLFQSLEQHGTPVRGREALAMLASERFLVLKRVEKLDRMVGMHLSVRRLLEHERERQAEVAIETLADLTAKMETPGLSASERSRLSARFDTISKKFSLDASSTSVIAGVKRRVQSHGLKLPSSDRVWATHSQCEVVAKLATVGIPGLQTVSFDGHTMLGPDEEFVALFGTTGLAGSLSISRCDPIDGYARTEALVLLDRLRDIVESEAAIQRRLRSLSALVPVPLACHSDVSLGKVALGLPQRLTHSSLRRYAQLQKKQQERGTSLEAMHDVLTTTMAKAIECSFTACLAECSEVAESDVDEDEDEDEAIRSSQLKMPERLYVAQRKVASEAMHRFLSIAHVYNGLRVVHDDDLPDDDETDNGYEPLPPILVYNATSGQLSMPDPRAVVERHWTAAQHLLDLAVAIEPWTRDRRRRLGTLLQTEEHLVTISAEKSVCVHQDRRAAACTRLDAVEEDQRTRYWPTWPPTESDLITSERVDTVVRWGRHAALHSLLKGAVPKQTLPPEPYRYASQGAPRAMGDHLWLYRMHARLATCAANAAISDEPQEFPTNQGLG